MEKPGEKESQDIYIPPFPIPAISSRVPEARREPAVKPLTHPKQSGRDEQRAPPKDDETITGTCAKFTEYN